MPYTVSCAKAMTENFDVEVHVVRWDHKVLTPYSPPPVKNIIYYLRSAFGLDELEKLLNDVKPNLVFVSGWMDKDYLKVCRSAKRRGIPVVTSADTHWKGSVRQRLGAVYARIFFFKYFDFIMIPGAAQFEFARRLGFKSNQIIFNFYSADVDFYSGLYNKHIEFKTDVYPKTILYIGRFAPEKNIELLIDVFKELQNRFPEWRLLLIGNGSQREVISASPGIEIHPFLPPEQLSNILARAGVFCLPSKSEPWGVVIHEMAAYGLPLVVSDVCGAGPEFIRNGLNGLRYKSGEKESLKKALQSMMNLESKTLIDMGIQSNLMSKHISPEGWAAELYNLMN